ncbi:hypothetical protein CJ030_MR3G026482 [Morella rubra]|uniref:F-box domain-containing protein n=1 Tax=Morella rubra TaxID=262757 RepID=A0A6A1W058_9ROSI|nr:hypothetical protein CJ030_MR3G026482 [Morella rubra]
MELVSDLPDDVIRDFLSRVPYDDLPSIASVCKGWMAEVQLPEFHRLRKETGHAQKLIVMAQVRVQPNRSGLENFSELQLTIFEPDSGVLRELPLAPGIFSKLTMFCLLAGVGSDLVAMGGIDPVTGKVSNSVFVYDFVSATWRRGVDMPGGPRSFFGCASEPDRRMVYVAGGHDGDKMALKSAMAYDLAKDEWVMLPDMARERDECKAIFHAGKFHVIGGYCTEMQGRFERSAEAFDVAARQWGQVEEDFLYAGVCPRTCVGADDGAVYMCKRGNVVALTGAKGQVVAKLPDELCNIAHTATWRDKLLVIGAAGFGRPHVGYMLDLRGYSWTKLETPKKYSGHVQAGGYLEI